MKSNKVEWVEIEKLISLVERRNVSNESLPVIGVKRAKDFMPTVANLDGIDLRKYKIIEKGNFIFSGMQTGRDICIRIGLYDREHPSIISPAYTTFVISSEKVLPEFFFMYFCREEMDRYGAFCSDGSVRSNLDWDRFISMRIPLPSIEEQQTIVDAWKSLRNIKEQNEALAAPLMQLCQSYIQECKHKYPLEELRHFITEVNERNVDEVYSVEDVRGLATSKEIIPTKANMGGVSVKSYKVFRPEQFAFVDDTSRRGNRMSLAVNMSDDTYIVSSISTIVNITDKQKLLPQFLKLWFDRSEFDRYARFHSWGSARESFTFEDMQHVRIPIPPIGVQRAIVSLYQCALEYKTIAAEADEQAKKICSPLLQQFIHQS